MKNLLILFGMLDLITVITFYKHILKAVQGESDFKLITVFAFVMFLSLLISGYFLIRKKKLGLWINYVQFPFRGFFAAYSIGFVLFLIQYADKGIVPYGMIMAICIVVEIVRYYLSIRIHRRYYSSVGVPPSIESSTSTLQAFGVGDGSIKQQEIPQRTGEKKDANGIKIGCLATLPVIGLLIGVAALFYRINTSEKPDLVVTGFRIESISSDSITYRCELKNIGEKQVTLEHVSKKSFFGVNINVQTYFSNDTVYTDSDDIPSISFQINDGEQKVLEPGQLLEGYGKIDVPEEIDTWKYLVLKIDYDDNVTESDEDNNTAYTLIYNEAERVASNDVKILEEPEEEVAESAIDIIDTLNVAFNLPDKAYEICYVKEGQLCFYDIKTSDNLIFPEESTVFSFVFSEDGKTIYYTVAEDTTLWLKRAKLSDFGVMVSLIRKYDKSIHEFTSATTGEKADMAVSGDTVSIQSGFHWEQYSFGPPIHVLINEHSSQIVPRSHSFGLVYRKQKEMQQKNAHMIENIRVKSTNGFKDLFFIDVVDTLRLSDISSILKEHEIVVQDNPDLVEELDRMIMRRIQLSPDASKLLFSYPIAFYDLVHGPVCIVNLDGTNQRMLTKDGISMEAKPMWLPDGNNIMFLQYVKREGNDREADLYMTVNEQNDFKLIEENIDYLQLR